MNINDIRNRQTCCVLSAEKYQDAILTLLLGIYDQSASINADLTILPSILDKLNDIEQALLPEEG